MRYYKIYSNACIATRAITEITRKEAADLVAGAVYDEEYTDQFDPFAGVDWDEEEEIARAYEQVTGDAIRMFERDGFFEVGDYCIKALEDDEEPVRDNNYGFSTAMIY